MLHVYDAYQDDVGSEVDEHLHSSMKKACNHAAHEAGDRGLYRSVSAVYGEI